MADNLIDLKDRLKNISPISFKEIYFHGFGKDIPALNTENYKYTNGRWHIKGEFGGLYSGENQKVCQEEIILTLLLKFLPNRVFLQRTGNRGSAVVFGTCNVLYLYLRLLAGKPPALGMG